MSEAKPIAPAAYCPICGNWFFGYHTCAGISTPLVPQDVRWENPPIPAGGTHVWGFEAGYKKGRAEADADIELLRWLLAESEFWRISGRDDQ